MSGLHLPWRILSSWRYPIIKRLLVLIAGVGLVIGLFSTTLLLGSGTTPKSAPSQSHPGKSSAPPSLSKPPVSTQPALSYPAKQVSCLDLPLSSQVITPDSCWQTGPTALLVVGTSPALAGAGAVAVVQGQEQQVSVLPASGSLSVVEASGGSGCVAGGSGSYYSVNLGTGAVGPAQESLCTAATQSRAATPSAAPTSRTVGKRSTSVVQDSAALIPPPVSPSYYEDNAYISQCGSGSTSSCPIYVQGESTITPNPNGIVVLDFGSPCSSGSSYGTEMFVGGGCTSDVTIHQLVQEWVSGYESDHGSASPPLTVAVGTSNSYNGYTPDAPSGEPANLATSGAEWYDLVVGAAYAVGAAPLGIWAASDMEQSSNNNWYDGADTLSWVEGYSAAAFPTAPTSSCALGQNGFLADFGDDILGGSGSGDGWTVNQIFDVSQGVTGTCAIPEIYYGGNAPEWQALNQWAKSQGYPGVAFTAVMVEPGGSAQCPSPNGYTLMSASCAWTTLETDTGQSPIIPGITQIATQLQAAGPQVGHVSPGNGPDAGGNQVVISGSGFLGAQSVYFGSTAAAVGSGDVNGSGTQITVAAPAENPGLVDVVVETSVGSSPATIADRYQFDAPPCTAESVSLQASSAAPGFQDSVSATATCGSGANPQYSYFTRPVGAAAWTLDAAWIGSTWNWSTTGLPDGDYQVLVWVSDGPYSSPQVQATADLTVAPQSACTAVAASPSSGSVLTGNSVQITAIGDCPAGSLPQYSYFTMSSNGGPWTLQAAWTGSSWSWSTHGLLPGDYQVLVWVSDGPYSVPQAQGVTSFTVQALSPCTQDAAIAPSQVLQGQTVTVSLTSTCASGSNPLYSYFVSGPSGGGWTLQAAWIGPNWTWSTAGLAAGSYTVLVWVSDGPYTVPQAQTTVTVTIQALTACTGDSISAPSLAIEGLAIEVQATSSCPAGASPLYSYFISGPGGGGWMLMAAWTGPSWTWSTVSLPDGVYQVQAWVSDGPYTTPQAESITSVSVYTQSPCTAVSASVSPSQLAAGQPATVTAVGTCPADTQPLYSYFTGPTASGPWTLKAAWIGPNWTWDTTGLGNGNYYVTVWVSGAQYVAPEAAALTSITVDTHPACSGVSATALPSTVTTGQAVSVTASSTCPSGTSPLYTYFTESPSSPGTWNLEEAWSGPTWTWSTAGLSPGIYGVLVWVSDGPYTTGQAQVTQAVTVNQPAACSAVSASAPSSVVGGQPVSVDATATCPSGAAVEYTYFAKAAASGTWTLEAAWVSGSWTWNTVGLAAGSYQIVVWASDGPYTTGQAQTEVSVTVSG